MAYNKHKKMIYDKGYLPDYIKDGIIKIVSRDHKIPLSDKEAAFIVKNFMINAGLLKEIQKHKRRPLDTFAEGFVKRCGICNAFRNYCCC